VKDLTPYIQVAGPDDCWPWTGATDQDGYGRFNDDGVQKRAHREMLSRTGVLVEGLVVCHSCDNPPCCNPKHLFAGTHLDNMKDMARKGRASKQNQQGESNSAVQLTEVDVIAIRASDLNNKQLAAIYGVTHSNISAIRRRVSWQHI
jgi:hypothetical protein